MRTSRRKPQRQIPIVSAIIALVFCGALIFGAAAAINARIRATSDDIGLHIDGTWEIQAPTYNDELITYVFSGDSFYAITESVIFDANFEVIESIREFHTMYNGATVDAEDIGEGNFRLRITKDGTFALDGNTILLVSGEGFVNVLSFYWESEAILINGDRFVRR